jgi:hypothetical protein
MSRFRSDRRDAIYRSATGRAGIGLTGLTVLGALLAYTHPATMDGAADSKPATHASNAGRPRAWKMAVVFRHDNAMRNYIGTVSQPALSPVLGGDAGRTTGKRPLRAA